MLSFRTDRRWAQACVGVLTVQRGVAIVAWGMANRGHLVMSMYQYLKCTWGYKRHEGLNRRVQEKWQGRVCYVATSPSSAVLGASWHSRQASKLPSQKRPAASADACPTATENGTANALLQCPTAVSYTSHRALPAPSHTPQCSRPVAGGARGAGGAGWAIWGNLGQAGAHACKCPGRQGRLPDKSKQIGQHELNREHCTSNTHRV